MPQHQQLNGRVGANGSPLCENITVKARAERHRYMHVNFYRNDKVMQIQSEDPRRALFRHLLDKFAFSENISRISISTPCARLWSISVVEISIASLRRNNNDSFVKMCTQCRDVFVTFPQNVSLVLSQLFLYCGLSIDFVSVERVTI